MVRRTRPGISRFPDVQLHIGVRVFDAPRNDKGLWIEGNMTTTETVDGTRGKLDWTRPVLLLFAACMIVLIVMPLSWLAIYSVTDKANHLTLQNFVTLFTDPDFLDPLLTTAIIATTSAAICCAVWP